MRRLIETKDGGFEEMLGDRIELWCQIYIYTGMLVGVNGDHLELDDCSVVYETGGLQNAGYKNAQKQIGVRRIMKQSVESWGPAK